MVLKRSTGLGLFTLVVVLSVISATMIFALLYFNFSYFKQAKREINSDLIRYVYESSLLRAEYELFNNPAVFEKVADEGVYTITDFQIYGITPTIRILPDNDGDGFLDIEIDLPTGK